MPLITVRAYLPKPSVCAGSPFLPTGGLQATCQLPQILPRKASRPLFTPWQEKDKPGQIQPSWKSSSCGRHMQRARIQPRDSDEQKMGLIGHCSAPMARRGRGRAGLQSSALFLNREICSVIKMKCWCLCCTLKY